MELYQRKITESINLVYAGLDPAFTTPPDSKLGDIALPCFSLAKILKKSPIAIADELSRDQGILP
jgi:arginyl-tRNA synthetase